MKRLIILSLILIMILSATAVLALDTSGAIFTGVIRISNNGTAATDVSVPFSANTSVYISSGFMNSSGDNTAITSSSGANVAYMPGFNGVYPWSIFVPSIGENIISNDTLFMGGATDMEGKLRYFPGPGGMTVVDSAGLELGDNFTMELSGFINTDAGTEKHLVTKPGAFSLFVSPTVSGNITAGNVLFNLSTYKKDDTNGKLTVTADSVTGVDVDRDEDVFLYQDRGAGAFDDINIQFKMNISSNSQVNGFAAVALANTVGDRTSFSTTDMSVDIQRTGGGYQLDLVRGNNTAADTYVPSANTDYWITLTRPAGGDTATCRIYTDSARTALADTLTVAGYGATQYRYFYSFVNINSGGTGDDWDGVYSDFLGINDDKSVTVTGVTSGEQIIKTSIGDTPDFNDWATDASIGVNMGGGLVPVLLLQEQELTTDTSSITFTDIDELVAKWDSMAGVTTRHLVIMFEGGSSAALDTDELDITFNADSGANYNSQYLRGKSSTVSAARTSAGSSGRLGEVSAANNPDVRGSATVLIPHAFNTVNDKTYISQTGGGESAVALDVGRWADTSAITSATVFLSAGDLIGSSAAQLGVVDERYLVEEVHPSSENATFSSITGTGNDLLVIGYARSNRASGTDDFSHVINADTTSSNYYRQELYSSSSSTGANSLNNNSVGAVVGNHGGANAYNGFVAFYPAYAEGVNDPTALVLSGYDNAAGTSVVKLVSARRNNVASITSLEYTPANATAFINGSLFSLYRVPRTVIQRYELASPATSVTFSNIPQGYEHLQLNLYIRSDRGATLDTLELLLNGDSTQANYNFQSLIGAGGSSSAASTGASSRGPDIDAASSGANEFSSINITFYEYAKTDRHKHYVYFGGKNEEQVSFYSRRWESTNGITAIFLDVLNGTNFTADSIFELVGVMPTASLYIDIDDTIRGVTSGGNLTIADNSADWSFMKNDVMPYMQTANITEGGILKGSWEWEYSDTFTDKSGNSHDATPSFRTSSTSPGVSAELITFAPITEAKAPAFTANISTQGWITGGITQSGNFTTATNSTYPGSLVITAVTTAGGVPVQLLELILAGMVILSLSLFISWVMRSNREGSLIFKILVITAGLGVMIAVSIVDNWILYLFLMISIALAMGASQRTFTGTGNSGNNMVGFLAMAFVGMTTINRILEGRFIQSADVDILRNVLAFQPVRVFNIFTISVPNFDFLINGVPALIRWDYSFFGGNAQIFQYLLYSVTAVVSFMLFVLAFGAVYQMFSRRG